MSRISLPDGSQLLAQFTPGPKSKFAPCAALPGLIGSTDPLLCSAAVATTLSGPDLNEKKHVGWPDDGLATAFGTPNQSVAEDHRVDHQVRMAGKGDGDQQAYISHG